MCIDNRLQVTLHGSIALVKPLDDDARQWLLDNVSDDAQWWAGALVVEPRYLDGLLAGFAVECV